MLRPKSFVSHVKSLLARPHEYLPTLYGFTRQTNFARWAATENLKANWDERTILLANMIPGGVSVIEFGAARLTLPKYLKNGCSYQPADLFKRSPDTIIVDLNGELPRLPQSYDYAVFSGVFEYVNNLSRLFTWLPSVASHIAFSYAVTDFLSDPTTRMRNGWVNNYSIKEIQDLLRFHNVQCLETDRWQGQQLYRCTFSKSTISRPGLAD